MRRRSAIKPAAKIEDRLVQVLRGDWPDAQLGNVNFFHFWNGEPRKGMVNIAWVKDLRSKQLAMHGYEGSTLNRASKWLGLDRAKFANVDMMACPTERFAEEVFRWYQRRVPWFHSANYPGGASPDPDAKRRREIVYIDNGSTYYSGFYTNVAHFMRGVALDAECKAVLISNRFSNRIKDLDGGPLRTVRPDRYDRLSQYGLLINLDSFAQADESLPRKILYYLHSGIIPLVHGSFTSSILYLKRHGIEPLVYYTSGDIRKIMEKDRDYTWEPSVFGIGHRAKALEVSLRLHQSKKKGVMQRREERSVTALNVLSLSIWDYAGCGYFLSEAINHHTSHSSQSAVFSRSPLGFPYEHMEPSNNLVEKMWAQADVIHIHDAAPKWQGHINLPRRPVVVTHHGSRYRRAPHTYNKAAAKNRWALTASTLDLVLKGPEWLPDCRPDLSEYRDASDSFLVCHAPTSRVIKNTAQVLAAIALLGVELDLVEGAGWEECLKRKGRASVLVDQFKLGYGCNSIEAWSMRIPTIGNGPPQVLDLIKKEVGFLPFVPAKPTPRGIAAAIEKLRIDPDYYEEMAERGHKYWLLVHSPEAVAKRAIGFYRQAIALKATPIRGGRQRRGGKAAPRPGAAGSQGMALLRYVGGNSGIMTFTGSVTGIQYKFGSSREIGYVDVRDAPAMLQDRKLSRGRTVPAEFKRVEA